MAVDYLKTYFILRTIVMILYFEIYLVGHFISAHNFYLSFITKVYKIVKTLVKL